MSGLRASNFRRIHVGLLLDLLLLFLVPAVMGALLTLIVREVSAAGMDEATAETLLRSPTLAVRALYAFLALQYCLAALCALLVVSGLGELEVRSQSLRRAKQCFVLLAVTEGVAMIAHISDLIRPDGETLSLISGVWLASVVLLLAFRALGLRGVLRGFGEVLESVGASAQARRTLRLSRHIVAAAALLELLLLAVLVLYLFDLQPATMLFRRALLVSALLYYLLCRVQAVLCARAVSGRIAALSE